MSYYKLIMGVALSLVSSLAAAQASLARPIDPQSSSNLISQVNRPDGDVPAELTETVRGTITRLNGDRITLKLANGEEKTYSIPSEFVLPEGVQVGDAVTLTVEDETVVALNRSATRQETTVIRRETTVQETTRPAPAPAPAPTPAPRPAPAAAQTSPQPVRGLW